MEWVDEGEDALGLRYDLYICMECGNTLALPQVDGKGDAGDAAPRYDWDPPDGSPYRGKRQK
jgi:hypothetical protein